MKIVFLDGYALNPGDLSWEPLTTLGDFSVYDRTPKELLQERIKDAQIVLSNKTPITREVLENNPQIKYIGATSTGYNIFDIDAAREKGIPICNVPHYSTMAVAQFTFALLLEICSRVGEHSDLVFKGEWQKVPDYCFWKSSLIELDGKTMGIIGFGSIGQAVAKIAVAMGMKIVVTGNPDSNTPKIPGWEYVCLDELLSLSDVISLHCPLFESTNQLVNKSTIAKMKDSAILINTSRGGLINEQDLTDALRCGKLLGAAADVVSREPIKSDNPLLTAPNMILTPHIAWAATITRQRLLDVVTENVRAFLSGSPINVVNGPLS